MASPETGFQAKIIELAPRPMDLEIDPVACLAAAVEQIKNQGSITDKALELVKSGIPHENHGADVVELHCGVEGCEAGISLIDKHSGEITTEPLQLGRDLDSCIEQTTE